ncbi:MAG: hypothetical protein KAV87_12105 [Desulfobacteraceae bacterium]|nr:hypothetical protein [Desulfobacteraceae bacterium]
MKKHIRPASLIGLTIIVCGFLTSPVFAGKNAGAGDHILNAVKNNPCGNFIYNAGGIHSVPIATCVGRGGAGASITILIRGWDIKPEYPISNVPFLVGIGIDLNSALVRLQPKTTAIYPGQIKFNGYRTEIRLRPYAANGLFNGVLSGDSSTTFNNWYSDKLIPVVSDPAPFSATDLSSKYYLSGKDTILLGMSALTSSYHASTPSIYKGEPAYQIEVTSVYIVEAQALWDSYQHWEQIGENTICSPGQNSEGLYECFLNPGDFAWNGHYTSQPIYGWGIKHKDNNNGPNGEESTGWVMITQVVTNKVRWPDGTIHDHIPILVYQSQPLLQKP